MKWGNPGNWELSALTPEGSNDFPKDDGGALFADEEAED
jgi:hypothetical protein